MLIKAASHLRPLIRLPSFTSSTASVPPPTTFTTPTTHSANATSSSSSIGGGSFTSNVHLLQSTTPGAGSLIAPGLGPTGNLGSATGGAPGGGWSGGRSNFNGYTGFGRVLTQTPSHSPQSVLSPQSTQEERDLERDSNSNALAIRRLRGGRPGLRVVDIPSPRSSGGRRIEDKSSMGLPRGQVGTDGQAREEGRRDHALGGSTARRTEHVGPRFQIVDVDVEGHVGSLNADGGSAEDAQVRGRVRRVLRPTSSSALEPETRFRPVPELIEGSMPSASEKSAGPPPSASTSALAPTSLENTLEVSDLEIDHPSNISHQKHRYLSDQDQEPPLPARSWRKGGSQLGVGIRITRTESQVGRKRSTRLTSGSEGPALVEEVPSGRMGGIRMASTSSRSSSTGTAGLSRLPAISSPLASRPPLDERALGIGRTRSKSTSAAEASSPTYVMDDEEAAILSMKRTIPANTDLDAATAEMRRTLEEADHQAYFSIAQAVQRRQRTKAQQLMQQYRNPLSLTNPTLAAESNSTPPPYFTIQTYNAILQGMNQFRQPGQPINDILVVYNELLERDILPNIRTYSEVMIALVARDEEIGVAQAHSQKQRVWIDWDRKAGIVSAETYKAKLAKWEKHAEAIGKLGQEHNYEIAIKLFLSATPFNRHRAFHTETYRKLMKGAAKRGEVDIAVQVWSQLEGCVRSHLKADNKVLIPTQVFEYLIETYGKTGQTEAIGELLEEFLINEKRRLVIHGRGAVAEEEEELLEVKPISPKRGAFSRGPLAIYTAAVKAYIVNGAMEQAENLISRMRSAPDDCVDIPGSVPPIRRSVYASATIAALESQSHDLALTLLKSFVAEPARAGDESEQHNDTFMEVWDAAILARDVNAVLLLIQCSDALAFGNTSSRVTRTLRSLAILVHHSDAATPPEASNALLSGIRKLLGADAQLVTAQNISIFEPALTALAQRCEDDSAVQYFAEFFASRETEASQDDSASSAALSESTAPTSQDDSRRLDRQLTSQVSSSYGRTSGMPLQEAAASIVAAAASGRFASPDVVGEVAQALARLPNTELLVRQLHAIALGSLDLCDGNRQRAIWIRLFDQILMSCCHMGYLEEAGVYRAQLIEAGAVPSADAYATMIASAKDTTDDASVARELWAEAQRLEVNPHLYLYNTIISKLSRARKAESAIELFMEMKAKGIRPSSVTYGAVINACSRVGDVESATNLFAEMQAMPNFRPRVPPYNTMMQLHLQTHPTRHLVLHYYNQLVQARVPPSAHTYKLLLDAYGSLQPLDLKAMEVVFGNLCADRAVEVQGTHWASIIYAYGRSAGDLQKALEIFESIPNHPTTHGKPIEAVVWEAIISVAGQHKATEKLTELETRLKQSGAKSTAYVNNMLIKGYTAAGEIDRARAVFESMADSVTGVAAPNNHPTLHTSSGQAKPTTTAPTNLVFREPSSYEAMIRGELSVGNKEAAHALCERLEARSYPQAVTSRIRGILNEA